MIDAECSSYLIYEKQKSITLSKEFQNAKTPISFHGVYIREVWKYTLKNPKGQSRIDNTEKLATLGTQDEDKQNKKHSTICVEHHYGQTNTNNPNKTWTPIKTTGDKDERTIDCMWKHRTKNIQSHNRTTQKTKKMSNKDPIKNLRCSRRVSSTCFL